MKFKRFVPKLIYKSSCIFDNIKNRIQESYIQYRCVGYLQSHDVTFDSSLIRFHGMPHLCFYKGSQVRILGDFLCNSGIKGNAIDQNLHSKICVYPNGKLTIGDIFGMSNTCIHCTDNITIGHHVSIGAGTLIIDTDFHSLDWRDMLDGTDIQKAKHKPIVIKDFAFIGANSIILKGVTIGEKARIGAGSVVTKNVPDGEIWAGNPAKKIGEIEL